MKECPHCHEDSFGWRELIVLDYFSPAECKACGKPVRNDGVRQLLTVPTILGVLFIGLVVFSVLPGALQALGFLFIFILIGLSLLLLAFTCPQTMTITPWSICKLKMAALLLSR